MSAETTAWVWKYSHLHGAQLNVHLAIGDVVNDLHDYELWTSIATLAAKARASRSTVTTTIATLITDGCLELLESGKTAGRPSKYRFLMPGGREQVFPLPRDPRTPANGDRKKIASVPISGTDETAPKPQTAQGGGQSPARGVANPRPPITKGVTQLPIADDSARESSPPSSVEDQAKGITDRYWEFVKNETQHPPSLKWPAIRALVLEALKAKFSEQDIRRGMRALFEQRRTLTRQMLWDAMLNGKPPVGRERPRDPSLVTAEAMIEQQRREATEAAEHEREGNAG